MRRVLVVLAVVGMCVGSLVLAQDSSNLNMIPEEQGPDPGSIPVASPTAVTGTLYFSEDNNGNGLYELDTMTGAATNLGISGVTSNTVGLSLSDDPAQLYGSKWTILMDINADGSGSVDIGGAGTEGLAFDTGSGTLYGAINGSFFTVNPADGSVIANLASPGVDIEGIAFGNGGVYGIVGFAQADSNLYFYDPDTDTWSVVGNTGIDWNLCGLAYDPALDILYAKGSQDSFLYQINPATAAVAIIGDTGIAEGGGLAFIPGPGSIPVDTTRGAVALFVLAMIGLTALVLRKRASLA